MSCVMASERSCLGAINVQSLLPVLGVSMGSTK